MSNENPNPEQDKPEADPVKIVETAPSVDQVEAPAADQVAAPAASETLPVVKADDAAPAPSVDPVVLTVAPTGSDVTPIADDLHATIAALAPNAKLDGTPDAEDSVNWGVASQIFSGIKDFISDKMGAVGALTQSLSAKYPTVQDLSDEIARTAAEEDKAALELLQKMRDIATGNVDIIIHDAELAVREIAFSAIPGILRPIASNYLSRITTFGESIIHPDHADQAPEKDENGNDKPQPVSVKVTQAQPADRGIAVALQHGIFTLSARLSHILGV